MNKNFMDKHTKLIKLIIATAALVYLTIAAFRFMHSQKVTSRVQTSLQGGKDVVQYNSHLQEGGLMGESIRPQ